MKVNKAGTKFMTQNDIGSLIGLDNILFDCASVSWIKFVARETHWFGQSGEYMNIELCWNVMLGIF